MREGTAAEPLDSKGSRSETGDMMKKWYSLIDKVYRLSNLEAAYRAVRANRGAPGVDRVTVEAYGKNLAEELPVFITNCKPAPTSRSRSGEWRYPSLTEESGCSGFPRLIHTAPSSNMFRDVAK